MQKSPKCFLIEVNRTAVKTELFHRFISEVEDRGYKIICRVLDVNRMTGLPVNEQKTYVIGIRYDIGKEFTFPYEYDHQIYFINDICEYQPVEEWYYRINPVQINVEQDYDTDKKSFLCWRKQAYVRTEKVTWNTIKVPLVNVDGNIRKITHREIARLKGYPEDFYFSTKNKAWLYTKLMYSSNIRLLYLIVQSIEYVINDKTILDQQMERGLRFEELFENYLEKKFTFHRDIEAHNNFMDFMIEKNGAKVYFELKMYTNKCANAGKILKVCEKLSANNLNTSDKLILVVGNVIEEAIKLQCKELYGILVWDIANVLFLFEEYPEIKNEFIALLNYTISDIELIRPEFNLIESESEEVSQNDLPKKLERVRPGRDEFNTYEKVCIEILKYVFGEFLTLWKQQQKTKDGLYRFDLCCKIKPDVQHEFFDTVKHFFNTKYIVFEFKNYAEQITQSEIYTTEKYLYKTALRSVAIIVSRKGANGNALAAARGCLRENGKLILCLSDEDLLKLINLKQTEEKPTAEVLSDMLDEMLINLEK